MQVNLTALVEYRKKDAEFRERLQDMEEVTARRNESRKVLEDLRRQRLEEFMSGVIHVDYIYMPYII